MSETDETESRARWDAAERLKLRATMKRARNELPLEWHHIIGLEAGAARAYHMRYAKDDPCAQLAVWTGYLDEFGGASASSLSDADIKAQAAVYASDAGDLEMGIVTGTGPWVEYQRIVDYCRAREVAAPLKAAGLDACLTVGAPFLKLLAGMAARVACKYWWRRALRKMVARKSERGHMVMGLVSAPNSQPYASNQAVFRRLAQNRRNRDALESITMENEEGYRKTLAELSDLSVSNKEIRRGELMTRIRGCEEQSDECGHFGLFVTGTCPSRFHSTLKNGKRNRKYEGLTPNDAQAWLCDKWNLARAKLDRLGVKYYGFRVAEPHHDGCTHWHLLIWCETQKAAQEFENVFTEYWLSDAGEEPGAIDYRTNFKVLDKGGAASYIAKYIAKNIDDEGLDFHIDDYCDETIEAQKINGESIRPCQRVEAWASIWGIRQFQALGQPPVTVWRELRRVTEKTALDAGKGGIVHKAWAACQRDGEQRASWAGYCKAQGGLMRGRKCNIKMRFVQREQAGLYGTAMRDFPVGVALSFPGALTVWSERKLWTVVETVSAAPVPASAPVLECASDKRSASARTRVNNCTEPCQPVTLETEDTPEKRALIEKMTREFYEEFPYARSLPDLNDMAAYFEEID